MSAVRAIATGRSYQLAIPIQHAGTPVLDYRGAPHRLTLSSCHDPEMFSGYGAPAGTGANEDILMIACHNGTHMDSLSHVFADDKIYNGFAAETFKPNSGASRAGIEKCGPVIGRAVFLDIAELHGVSSLAADVVITADDIIAAERRQEVEIRPGDIVLLRTGWMEAYFEATSRGETLPFEQPGIGKSASKLLVERDVAVVGSDNWAVESIPSDGGFLEAHIELQVRHGIPFIEGLTLGELSRDKAGYGFFVASPLPITGASGSPVNPVFIA
nr:cyclase family protein [Aeromicrobium wangtongii]